MKNLKRLVGILLVVAFMCSFAGCGVPFGRNTSEGDDTLESGADSSLTTEGDGAEPDGLVVFLKSDVKDFKIVYATDLSKEAFAEVQVLAQRINSVCDLNITVTSDFIMSSSEQMKEWEHEILIGPTNREESAAFAKDFRDEDYGYGYIDGKIVIGGGNSVAVKNAIALFAVEVIVAHSSEDVFYQSDWSTIEKKSYDVNQLTVNGAPINEYEIVYPANSALYEKEMAGRLQNIVLEKTGYLLPIKTDAAVQTAERAFLIGKTKFSADLAVLSANEGCVLSSETNVIAYGDDIQGVVNSSKLLTDLLFDSESNDKERKVTIGEAQKFTGADTFSVMTHNLMVGDVPADRIDRAMTLIYKYMPDTLGVQEAKAEWMTALKNNLSDYYEIVGEGREGGSKGEHTAILYAKTKYNLIESGTKWLTETPDEVSKLPTSTYYRIFTWALLEDKATGTRYLHVNTHLDCDGARLAQVKCLMQFLKEYNDVAIVLTGDMNASLGTAEMRFIQEQGFATKTDFRELDDLPLYGRGYHVVDWIFATKDSMTLTNYITEENFFNGDYASDHCSYYAEFTVTYPTEGTLDHGWEDLEISLKPEGALDEVEDEVGEDYGHLIRP